MLFSSDFVEYRLLRWLLASNRAHFIRLRKNQKLKEMKTPHQFKFVMSAPEKESRFQALKKIYGSFYAFHGSNVVNWHSILRNGLKTSMWSEEPGIFVAPSSGTSSGYGGVGQNTWKNSIFGINISCMALCEVIDHPTVDKSRGDEIIVHKDDCIVTRYFFVFENGACPSVEATDITIPHIDM